MNVTIKRGFMSFSRFFRLFAPILAVFVGVSFAAKSQSGRVHYAVGEVFVLRSGNEMVIKSNDPEKNKLKKAKNVKERDDIITKLESEVIIGLPDGSSFNVQENTVVTITKLSFEDGENNFITEVKRGSMKFDVQKQANSKSTFKFKTGTATAAIRGTSGFFGVSKNHPIASLFEGKLDFVNEMLNKTTSITGGQTIIYYQDDFIVMDLESSGSNMLFAALDSILADTTLSIDAIRKAAEEKDKQITKSQNDLKAKIQCDITALPDVVTSPKQVITAKCSEGTHIRIFGDPVRSDGNEIKLEVDWAPSTIGQKKIPLTCYFDGDSTNTIQCGLVTTYYSGTSDATELAAKVPLTITSYAPIEVCDPAMATVEGVFDPSDSNAVLTVTLGKYTSKNLVPMSANGNFSHSIPISDKIGNWNENTIYVNYESDINGDQKASIPLKVNKSCKAVNLLPPVVEVYANKCKALLSLGQTEGDKAIYTRSVDNVAQKDVYFDSDRKFTDNLVQGTHVYKFHVEDLAGNTVELNKKLECYPPLKTVKINFEKGKDHFEKGRGYVERLRVPPPPRGYSKTFYRQFSFTVAGLPQNDPDYIKEIKISMPGNTILLRGSDLISNRIDQQIELTRGVPTTINITVKLKSEEVLTTQKTYEVR